MSDPIWSFAPLNSKSSSLEIFTCGLASLALMLAIWVPAASGRTEGVSGNTVEKLEIAELQRIIAESEQRLLIVVMAAWCHPCIRELPDLERLYRKYHPQGLNVLGISLDLEGPQAMQPIIDRLKISFPVYWVGEGAIETFQIRGIPLLLLVQRGDVVERIMGQRSPDYLESRIEAFLRDS